MEIIKRTSLVIEHRPALDESWIAEFSRIATPGSSIYESLSLPADEARRERENFLADPTYNPNLQPRNVDELAVLQTDREVTAWKDRFRNEASGEPFVEAYGWRCNEILANIRMLLAASRGDGHRFDRYNRFVYGAFDQTTCAAAFDWFRHGARSKIDSSERTVSQLAAAVLESLPDLGGDLQNLVPQPEVFLAQRQRHFQPGGHYALLFAGVTLPPKGPVKPETGEDILYAVRSNLHADAYAIVDAPGSAWGVSHNPPELRRPATYSMPLARFIGLGPGHEWTHVLEKINGDRQPLRLSGFGLDRYENGNEGRAVLREQVAFETFGAFSKQLRWQDIVRRYVAIALAAGVDGKARGFREVFQIMNTVDRLWEYERDKNPNDEGVADRKADQRTWDLLARIFRGGYVYWKDKVYLEGNVACWQAAAAHPELIDQGDLGKFDITNHRHVSLLLELGVLPKGSE